MCCVQAGYTAILAKSVTSVLCLCREPAAPGRPAAVPPPAQPAGAVRGHRGAAAGEHLPQEQAALLQAHELRGVELPAVPRGPAGARAAPRPQEVAGAAAGAPAAGEKRSCAVSVNL